MTHEALLRALPDGGVLWMPAQGKSLWPLLRHGDSLKVLRCTPRAGDLAVVKLRVGLVAHIVEGTSPFRTAAANGVEDDPPFEVFGRVVAFRRGGRVFPVPRLTAPALRWLPLTSRVLRAVPALRSLVRRLRDSPQARHRPYETHRPR